MTEPEHTRREAFTLFGTTGQTARMIAAMLYLLPMLGIVLLWAGLRVPFMRDLIIQEDASIQFAVWAGLTVTVCSLSIMAGFCLSVLPARHMFSMIALIYIALVSAGLICWGM